MSDPRYSTPVPVFDDFSFQYYEDGDPCDHKTDCFEVFCNTHDPDREEAIEHDQIPATCPVCEDKAMNPEDYRDYDDQSDDE